MNKLVQLIQNQKHPVSVEIFLENGLSMRLENVKVFSNHFLVGKTNQLQGNFFMPIEHIKGYCVLPQNVKKDSTDTKSDKQKKNNLQEKETTKKYSTEASNQKEYIGTEEKRSINLELNKNQQSSNLDLLKSQHSSNKISNNILSESKPVKKEVSATDNIKISSMNGNSVIKDSGTFVNKGKG